MVPDLPGHGSRRDEPFTLAVALATVLQLVRDAAPRKPILAGDSLGGYVALLAAAAAGDAVAGVVAGGCTWSMHGVAGALARASDLPVTMLERLLGAGALEALATRALPRLTDPETSRAIADAGLRVASRSESLRELAGLDLFALVRRIEVPIVFVNGAWDWPTRAGEAALVRTARDASVVVVPRTGHGVGLLAPAAFAAAIVELATRTAVA